MGPWPACFLVILIDKNPATGQAVLRVACLANVGIGLHMYA